MNEQSSIKKQNRYESNSTFNNGPREYDIVVKISEITKSETPSQASDAMEIMTGGKQAEIKFT
jgi:hypothetical protein